MIDVSELIHDPDFESTITLERTSRGHFEKSTYVPTKTIITVKGIIVSPKNSKEVIQMGQGDRAAGYIDIYVDRNTPLYVTRDTSAGTDTENNISDVVIENYGTAYETRYRITNVFDRAQWGFIKAEGQKVGASG